MRFGRRTVVLAIMMVTMLAPAGVADTGVEGPDPLQNGEFTAAVPGTHIVPGWSMHASDDPNENWAVAERVDGDMKVRTLGENGYFGGPTNLGFSMERPTYSLLFDELTFEVTDTEGNDMADTGLRVMLLAEWTEKAAENRQENPSDTDPDPETSVAIVWDDVSTAQASEGLTLAGADRLIQFNGDPVSYELSDFSDEELANEWTMGGLKIALPGHQLLLDDFEMSGATLFGTAR